MSAKAQSPFVEKLVTNYAPSDSEIQEIHSFLEGPLTELALLNTQIEAAQAILDRLSAQREALTDQIDAHKALLSPMRRLPQDILQDIFIACLPTTHNALIHPRHAPLLLSLVCQRWRWVAHSTPKLWSSFHIPSLSGSDGSELDRPMDVLATSTSAFADMVEAWLDRSRTCPLSISFGNPSRFVTASDILLLNQLHNASHRIHHLDLYSPSDIFEQVPWLNAETLVPEVLSISAPVIRPAEPELWAAVNVLRSPNLRRVLLQIGADGLTLPLPWSDLTDLALSCYVRGPPHGPRGGLDYTGSLQLLRRCPNLVRCQLEITAEAPFTASSAITLLYLQIFIIAFSYGGLKELAPVIQCLVLPAIRYLTIGEPIFEFTFNSPLAHSQGFTVEIPPNLFPQEEMLQFLQLFPQISRLRLTPPNTTRYYNFTIDDRLDDDFLHALTPAPTRDGSPICPNLTHLYISTAAPFFTHRSIVPFICGRMASDRPLHVVNIQFPHRAMAVDVLPDLQEFIDVGLQVTVAYPNPPTPPKYNAGNGLFLEPGEAD
ncbi:hypothetical protein C8F04DRAFT_1168253 [Mycena alexandri]|uniref:F-box domain-containing protein n=1 Tax=Mycena alexandri TaxID=1745969 RepID=A0AAD6RVF9_9AGAR|nr:hypothetical protein C8F04DRAFT_1168253 [Mycena alexandri]